MRNRRQEQIGWVGGWLGGFIWVAILSIVFLVEGRAVQAGVGLLIAGAACASIVLLSPWRHPRIPYRWLMLPIYSLLFIAIGWGLWVFDDPRQLGFNSWWAMLLLLPALLPLWTVGDRRWDDGSDL